MDDARRRLESGALLIDVRDASYWAAGHVPGAANVPLAALPGATPGGDRERTILVLDQSGVMSLKGAKSLPEAGFYGACTVRGGMTAWLKRGLPLESGGGTPS